MRRRPTRLKEISIILRMFAGLCGSFFCVILAFVIPLWPITFPLFMLLALGMPFAFLGYRAVGDCPYCYERIEVTKKYGGWQCKGCKRSLSIEGNRMYPI